jgi:hypothetical protein
MSTPAQSHVLGANRPPSEILPYMVLSSANFAANKEFLASQNITHVINVADDVPCYFEEDGFVEYLKLGVSDFGQDKGISRVFDEAAQFVRDLKMQGSSRVLVHCALGEANRMHEIDTFDNINHYSMQPHRDEPKPDSRALSSHDRGTNAIEGCVSTCPRQAQHCYSQR